MHSFGKSVRFNTVTIYGWLSTGYGSVNGFIDYLYTPLGTTSNYSIIANLHTLQITAAPSKPFPACCVATSRYLITASNSGDSSASSLGSSCHSRPCRTLVNWTIAPSLPSLIFRAQLNCHPSTNWIAPILFFITTLHGPHRKHLSSNVACMFVSSGTCLPSRCKETAVCLFAYCTATVYCGKRTSCYSHDITEISEVWICMQSYEVSFSCSTFILKLILLVHLEKWPRTALNGCENTLTPSITVRRPRIPLRFIRYCWVTQAKQWNHFFSSNPVYSPIRIISDPFFYCNVSFYSFFHTSFHYNFLFSPTSIYFTLPVLSRPVFFYTIILNLWQADHFPPLLSVPIISSHMTSYTLIFLDSHAIYFIAYLTLLSLLSSELSLF
jgi:hypothetical protein